MLFRSHVSIGVNLGHSHGHYYDYYPPPPPPPPVYYYQPPCPGPGYAWISGYWYGAGPHRAWRRGYWAPPRHQGWHKSSYKHRGYEKRNWGHESRGRHGYRGR